VINVLRNSRTVGIPLSCRTTTYTRKYAFGRKMLEINKNKYVEVITLHLDVSKVSRDDRCILGENQEILTEPLETGVWESGH
jgi:hypothetical protein